MIGPGTNVLAEVPTTPRFTFDVDALVGRMNADAREGRTPFLIVGTAGTTGGGLVDPLDALATIAAQRGVWFHVDAAWGGSAMLVPRLRSMFKGIERADSVTWDAHKGLSVPMGAGMFFCRDADAMRRAFALTTSYMPAPAGEETVDLYATTVQWSRRAIGLKVFMTIAELGAAGVSEMVDHQARMGDRLRDRLRATGWVIVNDTLLPVVCFTYADVVEGRVSTAVLLQRIYARGRVWISDIVLGGRHVLRACITSFRTSDEDLDCLVGEIELARRPPVDIVLQHES